MKLGRNEPCHCGSGLKYKRCHLEKDRMANIGDLGARDSEGRPIGRPMIDTIREGKRVRAVGNRIWYRPPQETKQEFFVTVMATVVIETLGADWKQTQDALPEHERHPLALWTDAWDAMRANRGARMTDVRDEGDGQFSAEPTGDAFALLTTAGDIYTLLHAMALRAGDPILKRLGRRDQFQGARYELAVAAIMVRAGYRIEWLTETSRKLPEFIARRAGTTVELAVEAKSRPRPGLLGQPGERPGEEEVTADLGRLHRDALEKETDGRPYVVFLDMNLPPRTDRTFEEWLETLHEGAFAWRGESSAENPDPFSAVVLTNYSWHWHGEEVVDHGGQQWLVLPPHPVVALSLPEIDRIWESVRTYGVLPER
jgi:SEC-C motif